MTLLSLNVALWSLPLAHITKRELPELRHSRRSLIPCLGPEFRQDRKYLT